MALKIWTFLLVMSLPAAEHGHGFGSSAAVLNGIDCRRQNPQRLCHSDYGKTDDRIKTITTMAATHRVDKRSASKINNKHHYAAAAATSGVPSADGRCMARVQAALGDMLSAAGSTGTKDGNRRHTGAPPPSATGYMDLSGYALHQKLRTAPGTEMYVTGMRAKVLPSRDGATAADASSADAWSDRSWARVDGCRYDPLGNVLEARMRFGRALMVSGSVRLLHGGGGGNRVGTGLPGGETGCDMTLRLRPRAGLGFTAMPLTMPEKSPPNRLTATPTMTIRTTATFIDPEPADDPASAYVSVHSYNCVGGAAGFPGSNYRELPEQAPAAATAAVAAAAAVATAGTGTSATSSFDRGYRRKQQQHQRLPSADAGPTAHGNGRGVRPGRPIAVGQTHGTHPEARAEGLAHGQHGIHCVVRLKP
ncbi:Hypothetical protein CINCED_3A000339 [Cinara cedri]|uniref:Uncharacterized protein n=1 Tax=Cinara cedri TaxID=506608 RepID=A0A5E4MQI9_9HEMI|nr:Hypothetical protein CINCED_3A000339 [Cinara cedri]